MAALPGGTDIAVTHKFVSGKADGGDSTLVQPSKWNQNENLGAGADGQKAVRDSGQVDGASWVDYDSASLTNRTGGAAAVGDVVAFSTANDSSVVLDDTVGSLKKFCVALQTPADAAVGAYALSGPVPSVKATGAIARGDYVRKSATTKTLESTGVASGTAVPAPEGTIGYALTAAAAGVVTVFLFPTTTTRNSTRMTFTAQAVPQNSTAYAGVWASVAADTQPVRQLVPFAYIIKNLWVACDVSPGGVQTYIFTIRKNGVDQTLTLTLTGASTGGSDLVNSFSGAAGDAINCKVVSSATATTNMNASITVEIVRTGA